MDIDGRLTTVLSCSTSSLGLRLPGTGHSGLVSRSHCTIFGLDGPFVAVSILEDVTNRIKTGASPEGFGVRELNRWNALEDT